MSVTVNTVRAGVFLDSVVLMQISRKLTAIQGVEDAALMMATPANRDILSDAGLLEEGTMAGPGDLLVIPAKTVHSVTIEKEMEAIIINTPVLDPNNPDRIWIEKPKEPKH